ncbi:hypothetical protein B0O99DRAFT_506574 [Bisporella sp. PMI_857]|nr:hypothetical protein B0O99DRAFT_506574 [Bisporella sp. PMI_857]
MNPDYIDKDEDADARAMAEAMGFSSFGSQKPPAKKRKFNATTDAFVDGQELAKLDKGGKRGQGSGGNTIPLGKTRVFGTGAAKAVEVTPVETVSRGGNEDEIDLDNDDEQADGPQYIDTSLPPPIESVEDKGPPYVDTSQPPPVSDDEAREVQARIDALLASIAPSEPLPPPGAPGTYELPQRPPADMAFMQSGAGNYGRQGFSDTASVASSSRPSHRGQRNENWYLDYYDPGFNANPWEQLEKERSLEPLCEWPENIRQRNPR